MMDLYLLSLCFAWNMVTPESSVVWKQSNVGVTVPVYTIREDPWEKEIRSEIGTSESLQVSFGQLVNSRWS